MFRKPFDWRTRRNLLEAIGFYLIYVALGAAAVTLIVGMSIVVSLYDGVKASHSFAAWMSLTVMVTYYAVVSCGIIWHKRLQPQWFGVAAVWIVVLDDSCPSQLWLGGVLCVIARHDSARRSHHMEQQKEVICQEEIMTHP